MWQGQWSPVVYKFSSNWMELHTLHLALLNVKSHGSGCVRGTMVFYLANTSAACLIAKTGQMSITYLHDCKWWVQCLELVLGIYLQILYIPGVVMIKQSSDGLSTGVWVNPFQQLSEQWLLTASVFAPLWPNAHLIESYINQYNLPSRY